MWLPLPHVLMLPFVRVDQLWRSGLAGAIPSAACFVVAALFFFGALRRVFDSNPAAFAAVALFAFNPNMLYLQSTPMSEPAFWACWMVLLYFTVRYRESGGWPALIAAGVAASLGSLARYDGWFLIPFAALYILLIAPRQRFAAALVFSLIAGLGPLYWLFHNWWTAGDALDFYRGPYSAMAIQAARPYPGHGDWRTAWLYYRTAVGLCAGPGLLLMGLVGTVVVLARRAFWPLALLVLPAAFYVLNMHSGASPIFVPELWPHSYYNTRYGLAAIPLLAMASAALVLAMPQRMRSITALLIVVAGTVYWVAHPRPENWITWAESRANSEGRRAWTREAAAYLAPRFVPGAGIISASGDDFSGIFREMGIPLRETFNVTNGLPFIATVQRPDLYLWQEWAVVKGGDDAQTAINRAGRYGIRYELKKQIIEKDEPVIEIYRRVGGSHGAP